MYKESLNLEREISTIDIINNYIINFGHIGSITNIKKVNNYGFS